MSYNILIVDDDENIRELLLLYLRGAGFEAKAFCDARSAAQSFNDTVYALALVDVMLPDMKGYDLCGIIKRKHDIPVILVTARDMLHDKLLGFGSGADDYIIKPFEPAEVIARINARLRKPANMPYGALCIGDITVDMKKYEVRKNGVLVELKPKEIQLLHYLLLNKNIVFSRDDLLLNVWNYDFVGDTRTVDVHVGTLRQKLISEGSGWDIKTIRGVGYKLEGK